MKINIVTVYDAMNNLGSYLQAYALKCFLENAGHEVTFVKNVSLLSSVKKCILKINPKREFFLRFSKCHKFVKALSKLKQCNKSNICDSCDCIIYGSDEIWNMDNPYFADKFFFGTDIKKDKKKIGYALSIGEMEQKTLVDNLDLAKGIYDFDAIFVRDEHTKNVLEDVLDKKLEYTCDPTLLVPLDNLTKKIKLPKNKYILVYTYGVDKPIEDVIVKFARENDLQIVSPCFWHPWTDKTIECEPLQFSELIKHAEYVFTTTFHGAIFTMLNHKKCCILPIRNKVADVVERLGCEQRLISKDCTYDLFCNTINQDFAVEQFENILNKYRMASSKLLLEALNEKIN